MPIYALDHIQLSIPPHSEDLARAFYVDVLGFVEVPKPASLAGRGGAWFEQGRVRLHLGVEPGFHALMKAHPALLTDDLDGLTTRARASGYPVDDTQPPLEGYRRAHVFDPFGNRIELMQKI
jgi:catechol 2,3-dioxygenase-like lactoylglutathione lyase family enzyme